MYMLQGSDAAATSSRNSRSGSPTLSLARRSTTSSWARSGPTCTDGERSPSGLGRDVASSASRYEPCQHLNEMPMKMKLMEPRPAEKRMPT